MVALVFVDCQVDKIARGAIKASGIRVHERSTDEGRRNFPVDLPAVPDGWAGLRALGLRPEPE
jgi:hypothetical protein